MDAATPQRLILLGPQPEYTSLKQAIDRLGCSGPAALITSGWQDDEAMDSRVLNALPGSSVNLKLFHRSEQLFEGDAELIRLFRQRQDELRILRDGYRLRLDRILEAAREILKINSRGKFDFRPECELAVDQVRQLDRQYFVRSSQVFDEYERRLDLNNRPAVIEHREQIKDTISRCDCLVISGGHVAIILNRLRIFEVLPMADDKPLIAWSAATMALSDQIVLFHDSPPHGRGNAEVLRAGVGSFHEVLPLPRARQRLKLNDETRVGLFARRFKDYICVELNDKSILDRVGGRWEYTNCHELRSNGLVRELRI